MKNNCTIPSHFENRPENAKLFSNDNFYRKIFLVFLFLPLFSLAQTYPFTLPTTITASLNVETSNKEEFKNTLLGYNIEGFDTTIQKDFIRKVDPITIRFPHGVWANFYKWQTDGYQNDSYDNGDHEATLTTYINNGVKGHVDGIATLNTEKKALNGGKGFDMMWTYSINFDNGASCVARAQADIARGLEVKDIELGNEHFWTNQRALRTATATNYKNEASAVSAALKAEFPNIRVSIPLGWRRNQANYNASIIGDGSYFDALSIHKYLGADPDIPGESNTAYTALLTAKLTLKDDVDWVRNNYGPGKPVWLTEWGVSAGSDVHGAACLGMADAYLYMAENQQIYDRANWFSFNKVLNAFVVVGSNREPVYPLQKRGYLSTYEILHNVLKDATMLKGTVTSSAQLTTTLGSVNVVNARVATKDGKTTAIVVNLSDKPVVFQLKFDNFVYANTFKHEALVFNSIGVVNPIGFDTDPLVLIKEGTGTITLPALSVSKISNIIIPQVPYAGTINIPGVIEAENYDSGGEGTSYHDSNVGNTGALYRNDDVDIGTVPSGGYSTGWSVDGEWQEYTVNVAKAGLYDFQFNYASGKAGALIGAQIDGGSILFTNFSLPQTASWSTYETVTKSSVSLPAGNCVLRINTVKNGFNLDRITIIPYQAPFNTAVSVPGTIEAENYDVGGEGVSYYDTTSGNTGSVYRTDNVDVGGTTNAYTIGWTSVGEWLEYTIDVNNPGAFNMEFTYSANVTTAKIGAELPDEGIALFTGFSLPATAGYSDYKTVTKYNLNLTAGQHILRVKIEANGFNLDKIRLFKPITAKLKGENKSPEAKALIVYPNPSRNGLFELSKSSGWEVYNISGAKLKEGEGTSIDISSFSKGMYILKVPGESKTLIFD